MYFSGKSGPSRKVDLRGKSRGEETREQILERTRLEREQRKRAKLEQHSATHIQAAWRSYRTRQLTRAAERQAWQQQFGAAVAAADRAHLSSMLLQHPAALRSLLFFYEVHQPGDQALLAAVCGALKQGGLLSAATPSGPAQQQLVSQLPRLAQHCLDTLVAHRSSYVAQLLGPLSALASDAAASPAAALLGFLLAVLTAEHSSRTVLLHLHARGLFDALRLLLQIAKQQQQEQVRGSGAAGTATTTSSSSSSSKASALEVLVTQATARYLALGQAQHAERCLQLQQRPPSGSGDRRRPAARLRRAGLFPLLCVPGLWGLCGSLGPIAGRLVRTLLPEVTGELLLVAGPGGGGVVEGVGAATGGSAGGVASAAVAGGGGEGGGGWQAPPLLQLLPEDGLEGPAGAAGALLGNLLEVGKGLLPTAAAPAAATPAQQQQQQQAAAAACARQLLSVLLQLLVVVPLPWLGGVGLGGGAGPVASSKTSSSGRVVQGAAALADDEGDSAAAQQPLDVLGMLLNSSSGSWRCSTATAVTPPLLQPSFAAISSRKGIGLLKGLINITFPVVTPPTSTPSAANASSTTATAAVAATPAVQQLCLLLWQLLTLKQHQQQLLLTLGMSGQLVQRLWFSYLRPLQAAAAWSAAAASGSAGGWREGGAANGITANGVHAYAAAPAAGSRPVSGVSAGGGSTAVPMEVDGPSLGEGALDSSSSTPTAVGVGGLPAPFGSAHPTITTTALSRTSTSSSSQGCWLLPTGPLQDPGWLLPLLVASDVFAAWLAAAPQQEVLQQEQPLPLVELSGGAAVTPTAPAISSPGGSRYTAGGAGPTEPSTINTIASSSSAGMPSQPASSRRGLVVLLRGALWQVLWAEVDRTRQPAAAAALRAQFAAHGGRLLGQLYNLNCAKQFCPPDLFVPEHLGLERLLAEATAARAAVGSSGEGGGGRLRGAGARQLLRLVPGASRIWQLLQLAPCLIPFKERAQLFHWEIRQQKEAYLEDELRAQLYAPPRFITIRREQLLLDGFDGLNTLGEALKGRVRIQYVNNAGLPEAGVDGGGLFKDFMEELLRQGFDPAYGLFAATPAQELYPSPAGYRLLPSAPALIPFLGRMLGKALWEGQLLELPLAGFLLKKMRGQRCDVNDLPSLDPELGRHLLQLRHYPGDVSELSLTFTTSISDFGVVREVELKPGGADIPVTSHNAIEYIHRVADFRLNGVLGPPCAAFLSGFFDLIRPEWVTMFNEAELQMLISGSEARLDLADMQAHVAYAGGYHPDHPVIATFWQVLAGFSPSEQREFLKFVTSCSRAPLLGFSLLEPPLCIQMSGGVLTDGATDRLPTAATCMNLLKLPPYHSAALMREKLLYAIKAGAGFELS